MDKTDQDFFI